MLRKAFLLTTAALTLGIGCQKNEANTVKSAVDIPKTLGFKKPTPGAKLTKEEVNQIKEAFKVKSMMILPPGELVFPDKKMSKEERLMKEEELKQKDKNAYGLLKDVQANCLKGHPTVKFEATFPTDSIDESASPSEVLQAGDRVLYSGSGAIIGNDCPVDLSVGFGASGEVKDVNRASKELSLGAGSNSKLTAVMKNARYAELLGLRGVIVDQNISGVAMSRETSISNETKSYSTNALVSYSIGGSYLSLKNDIPYSASVRALLRGSSSENQTGYAEVEFRTELKLNSTSASVVAYAKFDAGSNETQALEIYVNGHAMSPQEVKDLFGENTPGLNKENQKLLKQMLN